MEAEDTIRIAGIIDEFETIRIAGIIDESVVDGPGIRLTIFVQGCSRHCPGCQNPDTHDPQGGTLAKVTDLMNRVASILDSDPLITGVTFSGGEPLDSAAGLAPLARLVKARNLNLMIYTGYTFEDLVPGYTADTPAPDNNTIRTALVPGYTPGTPVTDNRAIRTALLPGYTPDTPASDNHTIRPDLTPADTSIPTDPVTELLSLADLLVDGPYIESQRDLTLQFRGSRNQRVIDLNRTRQTGVLTEFSDKEWKEL